MSFRINRVYTRSGDSGETSLIGGARVSKADARVEVYGTIDEANAALGVVKEHLGPETQEARAALEQLQQALFDVGAELATPPGAEYPGMVRVSAEETAGLEALCEKFRAGLPDLTSFILPGGSVCAAFLHVARTVVRRAERGAVGLAAREGEHGGGVNPEVIRYLNRLSDLLFILARWVLAREGRDVPCWIKPGDRRRSE